MNDSQSLVQSLYADFAAGDVPGLLGKFADDIVWNEAEGFPYSDRNPYHGGQAVVEGIFARLAEDWTDFRVEVGEVVGGPEVVTMFGRYRATHTQSGRELDAQCAHTWWIQDGKIARFQQMVDTQAAAAASA